MRTADADVRHDHRRGLAAGATAYAIWGLLTLYWHALHGIDAFTLIAWRIAGSALLLTAIVAIRRAWEPLRALRSPRVLARTTVAALALASNWTIYVWCVTHGRVVDAALGYLLSPIGMVAAGALVLHEHLRPMQRWALGLAVLLQFGVFVLAVRMWRSDRVRPIRRRGAGTALPDPDAVAPVTGVVP